MLDLSPYLNLVYSAISEQRLALRARYANSFQLSVISDQRTAISATRTLREQLSAFSL
ncbi:MAG: hypothetical protein F6K37_41890 [Moorea sp. SIO4E2]|uniref:hypothetical protein n=1 Tax=Moorena sp. SIO4E2 TaxID=2607826 RepID=UPI0013B70DC4|nr:hypothetical protein [Moorena sp. SIO4E2]NEQ12168.1 hypothetical protein [Moorena sp. SIO4E2]